MKTNKLRSIMLLMAIFFSVSLSAFEVDGIAYRITSATDKTVGVIAKDGGYSGDVVIPESIIYNGETYKVTSIPSSSTTKGTFYNCWEMTSITLPNTITSIGSFAFQMCNNLTSIAIPNSVTTIGSYAFSGCSRMTSITISKNLMSIGSYAFFGCSELSDIYISDLSAWCKINFGSRESNPCYYAHHDIHKKVHLYYNERELTSLVIPDDIKDIKKYAFYGCDGLKSVTIPNSVSSIGDYAFYECQELSLINIPNSIISIGTYAFSGCWNLNSLNIGSGTTSIGSHAFDNCYELSNIQVESTNSVFDSRDNCNAVIETSSNTLIVGCKSTIIPSNVTTIGDYAFYYCQGLTSLSIPYKVTTIGVCAYYGCSGLTSITIPGSVTSIGNSAFYDCYHITEVTVENPVPVSITSSTFSNSANAILYVPQGSKAAYEAADYWKEFKEIVEITKSSYLEVADTVGFTGKQLVLPIELTNTDEIAGVQFKLSLPAGVSVALNSKNKLMFSKTERDADHTLSGSKAEDGTYTVLLYSADTEAITGNEGSIIDVTLDIDKEMKDGIYEIKISDIVLSTTKAVKINADDVTAQLEVKSYLLGDPNNDGSIDVVDITMIANHILGNNPENFIFAAADVDADGTVDVNDIISIANIILYGSSSNAKPSMAKASSHLENNVTSNESNGDGFTVKNVSVEKGGTVKVDFELTNAAHDFSGIQFDIDLGEGLSFATKSNGKVNVMKGARLEDEDFTLSVAKQEGNHYRALGYYIDGSVIPEKSGTLFTLTLQADESLADGKTFNCQLDNITLSTKNNEKIQQETQTFTVTIGDPTGISDIINEDGTPAVIYDLTGKRIETPAKSGQVIIIKKGGKVVKVFKK